MTKHPTYHTDQGRIMYKRWVKTQVVTPSNPREFDFWHEPDLFITGVEIPLHARYAVVTLGPGRELGLRSIPQFVHELLHEQDLLHPATAHASNSTNYR